MNQLSDAMLTNILYSHPPVNDKNDRNFLSEPTAFNEVEREYKIRNMIGNVTEDFVPFVMTDPGLAGTTVGDSLVVPPVGVIPVAAVPPPTATSSTTTNTLESGIVNAISQVGSYIKSNLPSNSTSSSTSVVSDPDSYTVETAASSYNMMTIILVIILLVIVCVAAVFGGKYLYKKYKNN